MAKFCGECGASLPARAKFCLECGTPVGDAGSGTASRGQSVSVGRDVGHDALTAGRDVIIQSQGQPVPCKACDGTGVVSKTCPKCEGWGFFDPGLFKQIVGCDSCGGKAKPLIFERDRPLGEAHAPALGKGNRGTGRISQSCSKCKGTGYVRV